MLKKVYYFTYKDLNPSYDPACYYLSLTDFLTQIFEPFDSDSILLPDLLNYDEVIAYKLVSLVLSRYNEHAIIKIVKGINEEEPNEEEIHKEYRKWGIKFLNLFNDTFAYYSILLNNYHTAESQLMADIKATSSNKVKFNDTPQNPNNSQIYEGDNYLTHFTATEGETSSPLMSKMMRLKEIQDHYKDALGDWVKVFERIFYIEEC